MPGFQANKLCPHGIFLPNRHRLYSEYSHKVFAILRQYSPEVHAISIDEGVVDLTGTEKLLGPPLQTADRIIRRIEQELGLPSSGGVSSHRVVSKIAATLAKPQGLIFVDGGDERNFLAPLPVEFVPGVGPKTQKELLQRGIRTIGDLLRFRVGITLSRSRRCRSSASAITSTPSATRQRSISRSKTSSSWNGFFGSSSKRLAAGCARKTITPDVSR